MNQYDPRDSYLIAVKRIFRYLVGITNRNLLCEKIKILWMMPIHSYFLGRKKQNSITLSTVEAKYIPI
ncbi:hypothetical protein CR513_57025, partial [Mucuna pruriens]